MLYLEQEVQEAKKVNISVNDGKLNDTNAEESTITIETANGKTVSEEETYKLYYVDDNGVEQEVSGIDDLKIGQFANKKVIEDVDLSTITEYVSQNGNEKDITLKLKRVDPEPEEIVGTATIKVNTIHPEAVKKSAKREGTQGASLKFQAKSGTDIVKVYYSTTAPDGSSIKDAVTFIKAATTKSMPVENNTFDKELEGVTLVNNSLNKLYFVVENAAGNLSTAGTANQTYEVVVSNDTNGKQEEKVTELAVNEAEEALNVTFKEPTDKSTVSDYTIVVYDENGEVVKEIPGVSKSTGTVTKDIKSEIKKAGKYSVSVITNGDKTGGTSSDSEETEKVDFEVTQLKAVTGVHFDVNEEDPTLMSLRWDSYADKDNEAFKQFSIKIYEYNNDGTYDESSAKATKTVTDKDATSITLDKETNVSNEATNDKRFEAVVVAESKKGKVLDSEETKTNKDYLKLSATLTATPISDKDVELKVTATDMAKITPLGTNITYDIEVWSQVSGSGMTTHWQRTDTKTSVTFEKVGTDMKTVLKDLPKNDTGYAFVLVAHVDNDVAVGRSKMTSTEDPAKLLTALPSLDGKVVVDTAANASATAGGKVYTDGSTKLYIDGVEVDLGHPENYYDPNELLAEAASKEDGFAIKLVASLKDGDTIVSVTDEKVTIKSREVATAGTPRTEIDAGGKVLELQGNGYEQEIQVTDTTKAKEVILSGVVGEHSPLFKITKNTTSGKIDSTKPVIKLANGVKILNEAKATQANEFSATVMAGATANINGIDISSNGELTFIEDEDPDTGHKLKINATKDNTINIDNKSGNTLEVTFMNEVKTGDYQVGAIVVKSNANVTVKAEKGTGSVGNVQSNITIETTNGDIDITDKGFTKEDGKTVVVSTTKDNEKATTIKANTILPAPIDMSGDVAKKDSDDKDKQPIEIKVYTVEQLKALRDNGTLIDGSSLTQNQIKACDDEDLKDIVDYFNSFGETLTKSGKVTVKAAKGATDAVEITIPAKTEITLADIGGLK